MPSPTLPSDGSNVVTTIDQLEAAPKGHLALDHNLLVFTKPFHESNEWLLGGFDRRFPAGAISLPARLYKLSADGGIVPAKPQGAEAPEMSGDAS